MRNPNWSRDEVILALDFYLRHRGDERFPDKRSANIERLSDLLNRMADNSGLPRNEDYRNANGVYMQVKKFAHIDPDWTKSEGMPKASKLFAEAWAAYGNDASQVAAMARAIEAHIVKAEKTGKPLVGDISERDIDMLQPSVEGRVLQVSHLRRERNPKLVTQLKDLRFDANGFLDCEVCAFDYERSYGERGHKFMEAHHKKPLSSLKPEGEKIRAEDYALICANCHRMIHRFSPWWSIEELRERWGEKQ